MDIQYSNMIYSHHTKIQSYIEGVLCCHANTATQVTASTMHSTALKSLPHLNKIPHSPSIASCLDISGIYPPHCLGDIEVLLKTRPVQLLQVSFCQWDTNNDVQLSVVQEDLHKRHTTINVHKLYVLM